MNEFNLVFDYVFLNDDKKEIQMDEFIKSKTNFTDYYKRGSNKMKIIFGKFKSKYFNNESFFKTRNTVTLKESMKFKKKHLQVLKINQIIL